MSLSLKQPTCTSVFIRPVYRISQSLNSEYTCDRANVETPGREKRTFELRFVFGEASSSPGPAVLIPN